MSELNPYAPPASELSDSLQFDPDRLELADRGTRLGAIFLDGFIIMVPGLLLVWGFYAAFGYKFWVPISGADGVLLGLGAVAIGAAVDLAINGLLLFRYGQTVGKRICKIRIAKPNGEVPSLFDSFVKRRLLFSFAQKIPVAGIILGLVDPLFIFRDNHRCLHDELANTIVVKADSFDRAPSAAT